MANEIGEQLNEIGNLLAMDTDYPLNGTFLYVEADWGWVDISIFKDLGENLLWRDATQELSDALLELWESEVPDKRWTSMMYRIEGDNFTASFTHDPLDPNVSTIDRREVILQERYNNKQVVYPPLK
jgi:hypothetical protein